MKANLISGDDVQRSLNLSDSKCINLYATTNNDGSIAAFYKVDGLKSEGTLQGVATGAYKTSGGRAFYVYGTTLYELTVVAGVYTSTSRGTVTAGNYDFSDNGIEMIMVNGTDGWTLTLADNTLAKIKVISKDFTVTIANPAVFTAADHGLVANDGILLSTTIATTETDNVLTPLDHATVTSEVNPKFIVTSTDGKFAYALKAQLGEQTTTSRAGVMMYVIDANDGTLSPLSPDFINFDLLTTSLIFTIGYTNLIITAFGDMKISPDGFIVNVTFSAYTQSFTVSGITIPEYHFDINHSFSRNADSGLLTGVSVQLSTNTVTPPEKIYSGRMVISDDGAHAYITNTAANKVYQYSRSAVTGDLTPLSPASIAATSPTSLVTSKNATGGGTKTTVHVLSNSNFIYNFERTIATGLLAAATQATIATGSSGVCKEIVISPDDKAIYITRYDDGLIGQFSRALLTPFTLTALTPASVTAGSNPQGLVISPDLVSAYVTNYTTDTVSMFSRSSTTFLLTALTTLPAATGASPYGICITPNNENVYISNFNGSSISQYVRTAAIASVGLPTGLEEDIVYYVISTGLTSSTFQVSLTVGGTAVETTGVQAGVHTFKTIGYGFPEGCTTVSYMNGRFIACEPSTQNFFLSDVLNGKRWDATNVQTVDSNPDFVIGQVVSHNELIVFCELSAEIYYDTGTTPAPFERRSGGIFEVGLVAPFSIATLDNTVYWLGRSQEGTGIIYKLSGSTPQRISNYGIEWQIQQMSTVTDARAFAYQKDGHHFYVITFPTGDKTFVYDVNSGLWHERARTIYAPFTLAGTIATGVVPFSIEITSDGLFGYVVNTTDNTISQYARSLTTGLLSALTPATIATGSSPLVIKLSPDELFAYVTNNVGDTISQYSRNPTTGLLTALSPASIAAGDVPHRFIISPDGNHLYATNTAANTISQFARNSSTGLLSALTPATIATGGGPLGIGITPNGSFVYVANSTGNTISQYSRNSTTGLLTALSTPTIAGGTTPHRIAVSPDNLFLYVANSGSNNISQYSINQTTGQLTALSTATVISDTAPGELIISDDGESAYTTNNSASVTIYSRDTVTGFMTWVNNFTCTGAKGIAFSPNNDYLYVTNNVGNSVYEYSIATNITFTYAEWPVKYYLYFNGEHLVTSDTTTALYSIDSATYKNGTEVMQWKRSFRAPQSEMKYARHSLLILDAETGTGSSTQPTVTLRWSDDNGKTYNTGQTKDMGITGDYAKAINFYRLGTTKGYPRIYELSGSSDAKTVLLSAYLE